MAEWLRSINCSQYVNLFLSGSSQVCWAGAICLQVIGNNITGANLVELDRADLKEMGVAKLGDQIRIASRAKEFRTRECRKVSKRVSNRVCDGFPAFGTTQG